MSESDHSDKDSDNSASDAESVKSSSINSDNSVGDVSMKSGSIGEKSNRGRRTSSSEPSAGNHLDSPKSVQQSSPKSSRHSSPRGSRHSSPRGSRHSSPRGSRHSSPRGSRHSSPRSSRHSSPRSSRHSSPRSSRHSSPGGSRHSSPRSSRHSSPRSSRHSSPKSSRHSSPKSSHHSSPKSSHHSSPKSSHHSSPKSSHHSSPKSSHHSSPKSSHHSSPRSSRHSSPKSSRHSSPKSSRSSSSSRSGSPTNAAALFGDADDISSDESGKIGKKNVVEDEARSKSNEEDAGDRVEKDDSTKEPSASNRLTDSPKSVQQSSPKSPRSSSSSRSGSPADAAALFGDADDISSDESEKGGKKSDDDDARGKDDGEDARSRAGDDDEDLDDPSTSKVRRIIDDDEEAEEAEEPMETRIDVDLPKLSCDLGNDIHFVKLPNFLSVETRPFDSKYYEDEIDEEETLDEEGRARLKLKVENTIRWREVFDKEGNLVKESNARFVNWSDGSMTLHLGSEIFDVYKQPLQGDHNHLFVRQGTGLAGQAIFKTKLTFRPHSTESFTHRKMTLSLADRSQKTSGVKMLSLVGHDPEHNRDELIKKEEERLRASLRRESKQKRVKERGASRGLSASYLEPDREDGSDDENAISVSAIKSKFSKKNTTISSRNIYSSDEDGSDVEVSTKKNDKGKLAFLEDDKDKSSSGSDSRSDSRSDSKSENENSASSKSDDDEEDDDN